MSNIPITSLPLAISLDGSEDVPIVQGGTTKRTTIGDIQTVGQLPIGGSIGQPIVKNSSANYDVSWRTLPVIGGGTGIISYNLGDILYASAANVLSSLSGNTSAVKQYLSQTGTGAVSAAPIWATISGGDITGAALTKTDDTNITLTLGGTPTTALLRAASITAGWSGTLSGARGGSGVANTGKTITIGGNLVTSGAFASTFTMTGITAVTFPTSGILATTSVTTSVTSSTYLVLSTDRLIEVNFAGPVTITLDNPSARAPSLYSLVIKDISGAASSNNITIVGGVDGVNPLVISVDYGGYNIYPSTGTYRFMP